MSRSETSTRHNAAIARAKREWQCIADALPQMVCLLDRNGRVVRANLVVERWLSSPVRDVLGVDLHELLHRHCQTSPCALRTALGGAWDELVRAGSSEFELTDELLGKAVKVEMKLMPGLADDPAAGRDPAAGHNYAIFIASDVTQLRNAQEGQRLLNLELEMRVHARTQELSTAVRGLRAEVTRREGAENSLRNSRNELSLLSEQLMKAQEVERKRIAQDLHDAVGQSLSAIKYSLERALQMLATPKLGNPLLVLNKTVEHVQNTIDEVRTISENLRPALLDGLGAVSAIRWLCREWGEVFTGIEVEINLHVTDADIQEPLGTTLFRTVQEALNNVALHSKATRVAVSICRESSILRADIADNGTGFDPDGDLLRRGHGLRGMRERAATSGGEFSLTSYPGGGTQLTVLWPIAPESTAGEVLLCAS
jgi:signal transduction histidine kinase